MLLILIKMRPIRLLFFLITSCFLFINVSGEIKGSFSQPSSQVSPLRPPRVALAVENKDKSLRGGEKAQQVGKEKNEWDDMESTTSIADGLSSSFMMIIVSELGDETFIIAALFAMKQNRTVVLAAALAALYVMTILSTMLGVIVPNLINQQTAANLATGLYIFFGCRLCYIAYHSTDDEAADEFDEVEEMLKNSNEAKKPVSRLGFLKGLCTPLFLEVFILTFSAEWGDRSQIATIALAAHKNPYAVTIGACAGHTICTSIAVFGGRLIAAKISQRTVAACGGLTFFVFAAWNFVVGFHH